VYSWIWRQLPGPFAVRLLLALLMIAAIVSALWFWVFPAVVDHLPMNDVTVGDG
jgi:hypothetical protein